MRKFEVVARYKDAKIEIPARATTQSAGYDLASATDIIIPKNEVKLIPTGLKVKIPSNEALFVFARSSLALKKHLMMSNGVGVVDADYYNNPNNEGEIFIPLYNFSSKDIEIKKGERIAQ
ncbi:MAG: dUTP diphosphatase, partial [Acholeplasmataceae bacterium]